METYTVQRGDSLFLIAKKFYYDGDLYRQLAAYNRLANPNALEVGAVLKIPSRDHLLSGQSALETWRNYGSGTVYWRVTDRGVEIQGKGAPTRAASTRQAEQVWKTYRVQIQAAAQKHGVSLPVIIATIITESSGNPKAYRYEPAFYERYLKDKAPWTSNSYYDDPKRISASYGLMQIMYTTAYNCGFRGKPEDLYDPAAAIDVSAAFIASAAQRRQHLWDPPKIACAYNAGSIRPTTKNAWGMHYHPGHLDRWIPAYNGAVAVLGPEHRPEIAAPVAPPPQPAPPATVPPKPVTAPAPAPTAPPTVSQTPSAALRLVFAQSSAGAWSPLVIDLFEHTADGLNDPKSVTIRTPTVDASKGYTFEIGGLVPGLYDLVFADAASGSLVYDVADYRISAPNTLLDMRRNLRLMPAPAAPERVNVVFTFAAIPGQAWRPMNLDVSRHADNGEVGRPVSYAIKIPSHSPDGGYMYQISQLEAGTYDFVFTDAASAAVLQDITDYVVDENPEKIDLRKTRSLYAPAEQMPEEQPPETLFGRLWRSLQAMLAGK